MAIITETLLLPFGYTGTIDATESAIVDPPANIIRLSEAWEVKFDWTTTGALNFLMAGSWNLEVFLEKMGGGEFTLAGATASEPFVSAPNHYVKVINFAAGSVPVGLYRATAIMQMAGPGGVLGPIVGHSDLGLLQFYSA